MGKPAAGRRKVILGLSDGTVHSFERVSNEHGSRSAFHYHAGSEGARLSRVRYSTILLTHCGWRLPKFSWSLHVNLTCLHLWVQQWQLLQVAQLQADLYWYVSTWQWFERNVVGVMFAWLLWLCKNVCQKSFSTATGSSARGKYLADTKRRDAMSLT